MKFPGLELEIEDQTEREPKVRNIHFKKVAYVRVAGRDYLYPMMICIAAKAAIDSEKYEGMKKIHLDGDPAFTEAIMGIGSAYFPILDKAVISLDQIEMTCPLIPARAREILGCLKKHIVGA